jgi:hypothetical protein
MGAPTNLNRSVAPRSRKRMQTIKRSLVQLQDRARPQFERSITVLHVATNNLKSEDELADAIFGGFARNPRPTSSECARYGRSRRFDTKPSRPMLQAARKRSGPISDMMRIEAARASFAIR